MFTLVCAGMSGRESRCAAERRPLLESGPGGVGGGGAQLEMTPVGGGGLGSPLGQGHGHVRLEQGGGGGGLSAAPAGPAREASESGTGNSGASSSCAAFTTSSGLGTPFCGLAYIQSWCSWVFQCTTCLILFLPIHLGKIYDLLVYNLLFSRGRGVT